MKKAVVSRTPVSCMGIQAVALVSKLREADATQSRNAVASATFIRRKHDLLKIY